MGASSGAKDPPLMWRDSPDVPLTWGCGLTPDVAPAPESFIPDSRTLSPQPDVPLTPDVPHAVVPHPLMSLTPECASPLDVHHPDVPPHPGCSHSPDLPLTPDSERENDGRIWRRNQLKHLLSDAPVAEDNDGGGGGGGGGGWGGGGGGGGVGGGGGSTE
uniref:Uncharacterized protein n=1 Tax=Knipowitschia caucasica TaxID=637954 RepID=A0AAV2KZC8_KNICA